VWRAYKGKEALRAIFAGDLPPAEVAPLLDRWCAWAQRSRLPAFVKLGRTIREHRDGILAAIRLGLSNGRVEGRNATIRLLTRRAFGFHSAAAAGALVMLVRTHHPATPAREVTSKPTHTLFKCPLFPVPVFPRRLCRTVGGRNRTAGRTPPRRLRRADDMTTGRCIVCDEPFEAASTGRPRRFCSRACRRRADVPPAQLRAHADEWEAMSAGVSGGERARYLATASGLRGQADRLEASGR
jgi:hypothetical protein